MRSSLSLESLSTYRTQLMGIATLMIIACHAMAMINLPSVIDKILSFGNLGVDIFLLLSGVGCYYSFRKRHSVTAFWKKRTVRMMIPYVLITLFFGLFYIIVGEYGIPYILLRLTTITYWTHHQGAWFVAMMIPLYLLVPLLYKMVNLGGGKNWGLIISLIILIYILTLFPIENPGNDNVLSNIQYVLNRIPSFIIGMAIVPYFKSKNRLVDIFIVFITIAFFALRHSQMSRPWMITPTLTLFLAFLCSKLPHKGTTFKSLTVLGTISLESYLYNLYFNGMEMYLLPDYTSLHFIKGAIIYALNILLGLTLAYYSRSFINKKIIS